MSSAEILARAQIVRANLDKLARVPQASYEEFQADFRNLESALHLLQTTIQALIDIASELCARFGLESPRTSHEILERLVEDGRLPPDSVATFGPIFGFRNRVVHPYDRVDPRIVFRILTERRRDLAALLEHLLRLAAP